MSILRLICLSGVMLLTPVDGAFAENAPNSQKTPPSSPSTDLNQVLYKGVLGNALDVVPMDPAHRVTLQRTNAVVSNTLSGRSLSILAKLTNPALLIGGIAWGLWAASNIDPPATAAVTFAPPESLSGADTEPHTKLAEDTLLALNSHSSPLSVKPASVTLHDPVESADRMAQRPKVIKIWLPPSSTFPRL